MINKRNGFKPKYIRNNVSYVQTPNMFYQERFDLVNSTNPLRVYAIVDETGKFAITSDGLTSDQILVAPFDSKNENQWMLVDSDVNLIKFFSSWKSYFSIELYSNSKDDDIITVNHSDTLLNGTFDFEDNYIKIHNYPSFGLAFKKALLNYDSTPSATDKESFLQRAAKWIIETFDSSKDTPLECVNLSTIDTDVYSIKWKFVELYDLRDLTDCARENEMLQEANKSGDSAITSYENALKSAQTINKDQADKLNELNSIINNYESNWIVRTFLKPSVNGDK